jgi:hypothetical protein
MKSNVHLQPINYKSNMPMPLSQVPNVATGIEEILKNHQLYNHVEQSSVYGQFP